MRNSGSGPPGRRRGGRGLDRQPRAGGVRLAQQLADGVRGRDRALLGESLVVLLDGAGKVFAMGKNTDNALGLGNWTGKDDQQHWLYDTLQEINFDSKIVGVSAKLATSIAWSEDGTAYAWGFDTTGQLGLGLKDDDDKVNWIL